MRDRIANALSRTCNDRPLPSNCMIKVSSCVRVGIFITPPGANSRGRRDRAPTSGRVPSGQIGACCRTRPRPPSGQFEGRLKTSARRSSPIAPSRMFAAGMRLASKIATASCLLLAVPCAGSSIALTPHRRVANAFAPSEIAGDGCECRDGNVVARRAQIVLATPCRSKVAVALPPKGMGGSHVLSS